MTIAIWCLLLAGLLPILTVGYAKYVGGSYDNNLPRERAATYEGAAKRAYAAHQNSFEAFPFFAAAVLVAELKGAPRGLVDGLAIAFILFRFAYIWAYVSDRATLRSLMFGGAFFSVIGLFLSILAR
jgi:uncharacterized MAPEG superfamily protein